MNSISKLWLILLTITVVPAASWADGKNDGATEEATVEQILKDGRDLQTTKDEETKKPIRERLTKLAQNAAPAIRHGAIWGLRYALSPDLGQISQMQRLVAWLATPGMTPDSGTRTYLADLAGRITFAASEMLARASSDTERRKAEAIFTAGKMQLAQFAGDPQSNPAERATRYLGVLAEKGDKFSKGMIGSLSFSKRPQVRLVARTSVERMNPDLKNFAEQGLAKNSYTPVKAGSKAELNAMLAAKTFDASQRRETPGKNLSANPKRKGKPKISADVKGWGFGGSGDEWDMADGRAGNTGEYDPAHQDSWRTGFAYPGGKNAWGGYKEGWHHLTLEFSGIQDVNTVTLNPHGHENTPTKFRVLARLKGKWFEVLSETENQQCVDGKEWSGNPHCAVTLKFDQVPAEQIRIEFHDGQTDPAWFEEVQASLESDRANPAN